MSKVYEALQHARAEQLQAKESPPVIHRDERPAILPLPTEQSSSPTISSKLERQMLELDQNLSNLLGQAKKRTIQFVGCQAGEGTSTIVRELAKVSAIINGQSVLLIDTHDDLAQFKHFGLHPTASLERLTIDDQDIQQAVHQVAHSSLFLAALSVQPRPTSQFHSTDSNEQTLTLARNRFDRIFIDTPPFHSSLDGLRLCKHVDGVVLVIEAERTRSAVIENLKDRVTQNGGKLLGIVFNKQRYYIPQWVYRWL